MTPEKAIECIDDVLYSDVNYDESIDYELTSYDIDWLGKAREALGTRVKTKPVNCGLALGCPCCNAGINTEYGKPAYCDKCGQALDWSDNL